MKKIRQALLALLMALVLVLTVIPVMAEVDDGIDEASFLVNGKSVVSPRRIIDGEVTMASAPVTVSGFCGWLAVVDGVTHFYKADSVVKGLSGDIAFEAVTITFTTDPGAQVRLYEGEVALRFTSTILNADYDKIAEIAGGKENITFGTYIVPSRYITDTKGTFTLEALKKKYHDTYVDVVAGGFYSTTDTTSTVAGSIYGFLKGNYTLDYTAVGYMKITYTDGAQGTIYAQYNQTQNSCNLLGTVLNAYNDRDEMYPNLVVESIGSTHSPYTHTELATMRAFLDRVVMVKHDASYNYFPYKSEYYTSPWKISNSQDKNEMNYISAEPPAGMTIMDAMGIYLDGIAISLKRATPKDGKLTFEHDSFVWAG